MKKNFVKFFLVSSLLFCFNWGTYAQDVIQKGDKIINLGIGLGSYLGYSGYSQKIPPISGSFEYGIVDHLFDDHSAIGVGGYLGYTSWKSKYKEHGDWTVSDLVIGVRGSFHYQFVDKLDTYAGVMLGYDIVSYSDKVGDSLGGSSAAFSTYVGARYYLSDNIAVYGELGYGVAALELGVAFKF
jgi:hypothetical protein